MSIAGLISADQHLLMGINGLAGRYPHFDRIVELLSQTDLKDGLFVAIFWCFWFHRAPKARTVEVREHLLSVLLAGTLAAVVARACAVMLPFRTRPRFEPALHFVVPAGTPSDMVNWSSFPSDHAALFGAFAVGILFISRPAGILALLYAVLVICMPRIYLGLHYPLDIAVGLLLGAAVVISMEKSNFRRVLGGRMLAWAEQHPGPFYTGLFLLSYEYATMFGGLFALARAMTDHAY